MQTSVSTSFLERVSGTVTAGASATVSVVATGSGLTYQWYFNGTAISGATSASYTIASTIAGNAGSYTVAVTNGGGTVNSAAAVLTINAAIPVPAITTQPAAQTVTAGTSATLSVVATGSNLTYQWYFNGTAISGATSASYTIASTIAANAGGYSVVVTNGGGAATSATVTLTVNIPAVGTNTAAVVTASTSFLATLSGAQQTVAASAADSTTALFPHALVDAETWTSLAGARHGLRLNLSTLNTTQQSAVAGLVQSALSSSGLQTFLQIRLADDVLASTEANSPWGADLYSIAFIGTPSTTTPWILQISGHNLALNVSYNGTALSGTPMFLGAEPPNWVVDSSNVATVNGTASSAGAQHAPLEAQRAAVSALAVAVQADASVATTAKLSGTFTDVTKGGTSVDDTGFAALSYPTGTTGRGVPYASLNADEKAKVKAVIDAWVNTQASDVAGSLRAAYESDTALAATYVGYAAGQGGTADFSAFPNSLSNPLATSNSYLRIDGPRVWIEFSVVPAAAYPSYVGYHTLWRDKTADYGGSF